MPDSNRIDAVLDAVRRRWSREPDLRLLQLLWNVAGETDPFYLEAPDVVARLAKSVADPRAAETHDIAQSFLTGLAAASPLFLPLRAGVETVLFRRTLDIQTLCDLALAKLSESSVAVPAVRAIQAACQRFLTEAPALCEFEGPGLNVTAHEVLCIGLGELRAVMGANAALIAALLSVEAPPALRALAPADYDPGAAQWRDDLDAKDVEADHLRSIGARCGNAGRAVLTAMAQTPGGEFTLSSLALGAGLAPDVTRAACTQLNEEARAILADRRARMIDWSSPDDADEAEWTGCVSPATRRNLRSISRNRRPRRHDA